MRDFRTQTTRVWDKLNNEEEIVITNNGRPRAFLVSIPDGFFDEILTGIRQVKTQIKPRLQENRNSKTQLDFAAAREHFDREHSTEEMTASWRSLKEMLSGIDGGEIDLRLLRAERRASKYERDD
jgi:antitoxin (DNA-binding transcriptional repressor) of toxin-antitoxin stability system